MNRLIDRLANASPTMRIDPDACVTPVRETVERVFENQPVSVTTGTPDQGDEIVVARDGGVVASSSTDELLRSLLLVNSDVYLTGGQDLEEIEVPDILKALEETPFQLRGYPESDSEKLILTVISREIERIAYERGEGTLRVGFQYLSRLVDEPGTYEVYEQLCDTDLDVHVYGVEDARPPAELDLTVHPGTSEFHRRSWFVVFDPPSSDERPAGLYAIEREPNHWDGFWTFRSESVESICGVIEDSSAPASD